MIGESLDDFYSRQDFILATLDDNKRSGLNVAPLLAMLHVWEAGLPTNLSLHHPLLLATVAKLEDSFRYEISAPWIGRYPEDVYDGTGYSRGNPWVLCTLALAHHAYALIEQHKSWRQITIDPLSLQFYRKLDRLNSSWIAVGQFSDKSAEYPRLLRLLAERGDEMLAVAKITWSEQIDRVTGHAVGARNLTWSYVAYLNAVDARRKAFGPSAPCLSDTAAHPLMTVQ